ncbi:MAG: NlpC/P60 family protein [Smithellaceae bacterium]|jgi:cell wall-associated NlpC family hydrolase|nr:C40 family peptidase [Syntrophaceae bacterium]HPL97874.1 NlpC/P60 family protein [Smithellaceae bacterium]
MLQRRISSLTVIISFLLLVVFSAVSLGAEYTVKAGDSLEGISRHLGVSVNEIKEINNLANDKIFAGQIISYHKENAPAATVAKTAPVSPRFYTVKNGDTLSAIARKTGVPVRQIMALNNVEPKRLRPGRKLILEKLPQTAASGADVEDLLADDEEDDDAATAATGEELCEESVNEVLLGKWGSAEERKLFVKVATGFLGAPYRLGGATVRGIDCSAFVRKMYEFFDIELPRTAREQSTVGIRVKRDELEEGDLVFFRTKKPIGHVGIYIGNNEFVHASHKAKAVRIDSLDRPYFQKRFRHAVRVKGLDEQEGT